MQINILEPEKFSRHALELLARLGSVSKFDGSSLDGFLSEAEVLFVRLGYQIDKSFLDKAPKLRWICSPTTAHTHIDEIELKKRGISLISLKGEREFLDTVRATPEHTFGLILAVLRKYSSAVSVVSEGAWNRNACLGTDLFGKNVGVLGLGRVGHRVAEYCDAFGARIFYFDKRGVVARSNWTLCDDVSSLIECSEIIVLCASYDNGQPKLLGSKEIGLMSGKYFVNTARGELVDEVALISAIEKNRLAGVAIDVLARENQENNLCQWRRFLKTRNLFITPHIGGATEGAMSSTEVFIAEKFQSKLQEREKPIRP